MNVESLITLAGGTTRLGRILNLHKTAPYRWKLIPPKHVPALSREFNIPRHELRPDLWDAPEVAL